MKKWIQSLTGLVMSAFLALGLGGKVMAEDQEDSLPEPAATEAVESKPAPAAEAPKPAEAKPAEVKPAEAKPAAEAPKAAAPSGNSEAPKNSSEAKPAESKPAEAKPTESKPAESKPAEAKPAEAKPAENKTSEAKPAEAKPAETKPAETKPADTKPAETKPAESKPEDTKPAESKPAETKPAESKPEEAKPAESKSAEEKPAESKPAEAKPSEPAPVSEAPKPAEAASSSVATGPADPAPTEEAPRPAEAAKPAEPAPAAEPAKTAEAVPAEVPGQPDPAPAAGPAKEAGTEPIAEAPAASEPTPAKEAAITEGSASGPAAADTVEMSDTDASAGSPAASEPAPAAEALPLTEPAAAEAPSEPEPPADAPAADEAGSVSGSSAEDETGPVSEVSSEAEPAAAEVPAAKELSSEAPAADETEPVRAVPAAGEAEPAAGISSAEEPAPDEKNTQPVPEAIVEGETDLTGEETENAAPVADTLFMETESVSVSRSAANAGQSASKTTIGGKDVSAQDGWTYKDGQIRLVNFDQPGTDVVSSGLDGLNIAAAGFNHLRSVVSAGDIHITGTGILLLDDVALGENSGFYLHTFTNLYKEGTGSVAVFLRQYDNLYMMVNGSVPGILDEQYIIKNADLLIPSGSTLLMDSGETALDKVTRDVVGNWHGGEKPPEGFNANNYDMLCSESSLTLEDSASLTVENGAVIKTISDLGPPPSITAKGNSSVVVDGTLTDRIDINLEGSSSLSGSGSITGHVIKAESPANIANCGVTLQGEIDIRGKGGSIKNLKIKDSKVFFNDYDEAVSSVSVGSLSNSGDSVIISSDPLTINKITNSGELLFSCGTNVDNGPSTELTGPVSGGGIQFGDGFFRLAPGFSLKNGATLKYDNVLVYDYSKTHATAFSSAPLVASPATVTRPALDNSGRYVVPLVVFEEGARYYYGNRYSIKTMNNITSTEVYANKTDTGDYVIDLSKADTWSDGSNPIPQDRGVYLEIFSMDSQGNLSRSSMAWDPSAPASLPLNDIYLIRAVIINIQQIVHPVIQYAPTSTSYTGSGILGSNSSAGSGTGSLISLRRMQKPEENHDPVGPDPVDPEPVDPDPVTPDPVEPEPAPAAVQQTDLRVIVSTAETLHTVRIYDGMREVTDLGRKVTARFKFTLPAGWNKNCLFAVFRNDDGSLTAFKAAYDEMTGMLSFDTDITGTFALVCFPFDGKLYSADFYDALSELEIIQDLPVRR